MPIAMNIIRNCLILLSLTSLHCDLVEAKGIDPSYRAESSQAFYHNKKNARVLYMQAEIAMRGNDLNRAVELGRQAVELDPDDMDARIVYGEALYKKYESNKEDPKVYNDCVRTWLVVHRNIVGFESNESYKGISIPLMNKFYEDDSQGIIAKKRLESLCGRLPKFWETNKKFLKKVLVPEVKVRGKIVKAEAKEKEESSR